MAVVVSDDAIGEYYARLFRADWRGAAWRVHWLTLVGGMVCVVIAMGFATRIEFESSPEP